MRPRGLSLVGTLVLASCATFNTSPILTPDDLEPFYGMSYVAAISRTNWRPRIEIDLPRWCDRSQGPRVNLIDGFAVIAPEVERGTPQKQLGRTANRATVRDAVRAEDIAAVSYLTPAEAEAEYEELCPCPCGVVELHTVW